MYTVYNIIITLKLKVKQGVKENMEKTTYDPQLPSIDRPLPLSDHIYEILRKRILNGEIPPGSKLIEEQLASQLTVSRTPVREAIKRLQVEGLVRSTSTGHSIVQPITRQQILQALDIRELLEGFACKKAAKMISGEQIARLIELHQEEARCLAEGNVEHMSELNTAIHHEILSAAGSQVLIQMIDYLSARVPSYQIFALGDIQNIEWFASSHGRIIDALIDGDPEGAEKEIISHIQLAKKIMTDTL